MRFVAKDWDVLLIKQLELCDAEKPIISVYPADFDTEDTPRLVMRPSGFGPHGVPHFKAIRLKEASAGGLVYNRPTRSGLWAAGFSFSKGDLVSECPYESVEQLGGELFFGEEILQMQKFFSSGF